MYHKKRVLSTGVLLVMLALLAQAAMLSSSQVSGPAPSAASGMAPVSISGASSAQNNADVQVAGNNIVGQSYKNDVSPALRDIAPIPPSSARKAEEENENPSIRVPGQKDETDTVVQRGFGDASSAIAAPLTNWNGVGSQGSGSGGCNCAPPDTNGEVGRNHYVQTVNTAFQIWDKSGVSLYGPANINTIWSGFGGACATRNDGDPVVLYDQLADRWLISQFTSASPYNECIAISTTSDPTGSWNRYAFQLSTTDFPDYPHLGVWPDGYYMTVNWFSNGRTYAGPRPYVFNRTAMLAGTAATFQSTSAALGSSVAPMLPSDLDGATTPPANSPNYFAQFGNPMKIWNYHVDWATPANSTFSNTANVAVAAFSQLCGGSRDCIAQPGVAQKLDAISDRLMHRLAYRNYGDHESLVVTQNVDAGGGQAGVRWYELRSPGNAPSVYQQGTYAPDATSRWMGSAAQNANGDLAVGYSASSSSVYPSIRYAGRLASDPLNTLPQGEGSIVAGAGSQSGVNRWGDYSAMSVDPADDCTFWYTTEYNESTNWYWKTKIGSFRVGSCAAGTPVPTATATVTTVPPTATTVPPTATVTPVPPTATPAPPTATPNPNAADFTLSATPTSRTVTRGSSTTYTVNLASVNSFAGSVSLSVSGLPSRTSGSFSPNPVTITSGGTGSSTLTITTQRTGGKGTYTLTITGTGGGTTHTQMVTLIIQ